jgi:23S rRNA-/tRNA-specific pseudouridylate synthase
MSGPSPDFWTTLPLGRGVELIKHDPNGLASFAKPAGVLSHPNEPGEEPRALLTVPYVFEGEYFQWLGGDGTQRRLWLLNRLDAATSGVILAAGNEELAIEVRAQFRRKQVKKIYAALVFGGPAKTTELWRDMLAVEKRAGRIRTVVQAGSSPSETKMSVVRLGRGDPKLSLIKLEPVTGRSHQLRVQCAKRHLSIVGDQTYGDFGRNRAFAKASGVKRLCLHSYETSFSYDWRDRTYEFATRAEMPPEFTRDR